MTPSPFIPSYLPETPSQTAGPYVHIGLATRMYFGDEGVANGDDPVLNIIEQPERRKTLIAPRSDRDGAVVYTFDIHLQGDHETVFFDA